MLIYWTILNYILSCDIRYFIYLYVYLHRCRPFFSLECIVHCDIYTNVTCQNSSDHYFVNFTPYFIIYLGTYCSFKIPTFGIIFFQTLETTLSDIPNIGNNTF